MMGYAFLFVLSFLLGLKFVENFPDCPPIYKRFSNEHSYCKPKNASCNILRNRLTNEEIEKVVKLHNSFRSFIAMAAQGPIPMPNAKPAGYPFLPPAANMLEMEWDDELAAVAQKHADQCIYAHDRPNQRRVQNFGVGQNIALQTLTGQNVVPPPPDWDFAVLTWFEEIIFFNALIISPFKSPLPGVGEYRHFSQVIWSSTFRVGCGYTLYQNGNTYVRLYVCNYGPGGNVYDTEVYKKGAPCSQCPQNTCCGEKCGFNPYPGLCRRKNMNEPPLTPMLQPTIFNCDFQNALKEDCLMKPEGENRWLIMPALEGNYLEIVLSKGQTSKITFSKMLKPNLNPFCVQIRYRKGPNIDGSFADNTATEFFIIPSMNNFKNIQTLPSYSADSQHQFSSFSVTLGWNQETELEISFAAGPLAEPQFFHIDSIIAMDGACQN